MNAPVPSIDEFHRSRPKPFRGIRRTRVQRTFPRNPTSRSPFLCLPKAKRQDMNVFYTFCRLVDDIADAETLPPEEKSAFLNAWRAGAHRAGSPSDKREQPRALARGRTAQVDDEISDPRSRTCWRSSPASRWTWTAGNTRRSSNCGRTATAWPAWSGWSASKSSGTKTHPAIRYAEDLGLALQLTNIIRDVGVDLDNGGRIYLPTEDLERFGYTTADLRARTNDAALPGVDEDSRPSPRGGLIIGPRWVNISSCRRPAVR